MNDIKDGGPAFPVSTIDGFTEYGMTLRDYFAAQALQGICASGPNFGWTKEMLSKEAYGIADAMLSARETGK